MNRKEWREVCRQSIFFMLAAAGLVLLALIGDLLIDRPLSGEKIALILGLWLLTFAMFMGLSPFAMDSRQKGMEYLLSLPITRRRLLLIKFLPRLVAVALFFILYALLYRALGNPVFGSGTLFLSLVYFSLFFISFSLSVVDENFIVQSLWAGIALSGYVLLCLFIIMKGFSWKFNMPAFLAVSSAWQGLSYDAPTLLSASAVFLLLALPFILSFILAFKRFDLKPARAFNRRQLRLFLPLLVLAFAASLGMTYLVQKSSTSTESDFHILNDLRLLEMNSPGKLILYGENGRQRIDTRGAFFWDRLVREDGKRLFLSGYDPRDGARFIGRLDRADLSWRILHRLPSRYFVAPGYQSFRHDGENFVYLRRSRAEAERQGRDSWQTVKSDLLELVRIDPDNGETRTISFRNPLFRKYYEPRFIGHDTMGGLRFWLVAHKWQNVLRLWEDGRVEDLGVSKGIPAYGNGLLFTRSEKSLIVRRLLAEGGEIIREIGGDFELFPGFNAMGFRERASELYAQRDQRIVRINLAHPDGVAVDDVGPWRGHIWRIAADEYYYIEFENWPGRAEDRWKKLYRLQGGRMVFLKKFDFAGSGYGHVLLDASGVSFVQQQGEKVRFFSLPDLREMKFKKLN